MTNPHIGSSFDDFLKEEGLHEEITTATINQVMAWQIEQLETTREDTEVASA